MLNAAKTILTSINAAYDSVVGGQKVKAVTYTPIKNVKELGDAPHETHAVPGESSVVSRKASQNLLRMDMIEMRRRNGNYEGLNAVIDIESNVSQILDPVTTASRTGIYCKSDASLLSSGSHGLSEVTSSSASVFDVEEPSSTILFTEEDNDNRSDESDDSMVSVYANPNFGCGQRDATTSIQFELPLTSNQEMVSPSDDTTEVILSALISDPVVRVEVGESEAFLQESEPDNFHDPGDEARQYTHLISVIRRQKVESDFGQDQVLEKVATRSRINAVSVVTNIPCDSWIVMPLRMLPGELVPHGLVIFFPLILTILSLLTVILL